MISWWHNKREHKLYCYCLSPPLPSPLCTLCAPRLARASLRPASSPSPPHALHATRPPSASKHQNVKGRTSRRKAKAHLVRFCLKPPPTQNKRSNKADVAKPLGSRGATGSWHLRPQHTPSTDKQGNSLPFTSTPIRSKISRGRIYTYIQVLVPPRPLPFLTHPGGLHAANAMSLLSSPPRRRLLPLLRRISRTPGWAGDGGVREGKGQRRKQKEKRGEGSKFLLYCCQGLTTHRKGGGNHTAYARHH